MYKRELAKGWVGGLIADVAKRGVAITLPTSRHLVLAVVVEMIRYIWSFWDLIQ